MARNGTKNAKSLAGDGRAEAERFVATQAFVTFGFHFVSLVVLTLTYVSAYGHRARRPAVLIVRCPTLGNTDYRPNAASTSSKCSRRCQARTTQRLL
jgi:hypothetical protein